MNGAKSGLPNRPSNGEGIVIMKFRGPLLAACGLVAIATADSAFAQDAATAQADQATAAGDSGAIVVTARRRDERQQDVPISVTALSGDVLAQRQITDAVSLGANVPSLNMTAAGALKSTVAFSIRGQR